MAKRITEARSPKLLSAITIRRVINYNTNLLDSPKFPLRGILMLSVSHFSRLFFTGIVTRNLESAFKFVARSDRLASRIPKLNCANREGGGRTLCTPAVEILILASAFSLSSEGVAGTC